MTQKIRKAVFPVAGLGTRFLPATKVLPKEMLPLVDRPIIQRAVEEAQEAGIEEFIFVIGRGKSKVVEHFDKQPELMDALEKAGKKALLEKVQYSDIESGHLQTVTQQLPLGLGHAVLCAAPLVGNEPFALLLPDVATLNGKPCLAQMVEHYNGDNMIAAVQVPQEDVNKYGILEMGDHTNDLIRPITSMVEKPAVEDAPSNWSILGRYILKPQIFDYLREGKKGAGGEIQLTDAMVALMKDQDFDAFLFGGQHFDCGQHIGFIEANIAFALSDPKFADKMKDVLAKFAPSATNNQAA